MGRRKSMGSSRHIAKLRALILKKPVAAVMVGIVAVAGSTAARTHTMVMVTNERDSPKS
jgi:hypothetical protein